MENNYAAVKKHVRLTENKAPASKFTAEQVNASIAGEYQVISKEVISRDELADLLLDAEIELDNAIAAGAREFEIRLLKADVESRRRALEVQNEHIEEHNQWLQYWFNELAKISGAVKSVNTESKAGTAAEEKKNYVAAKKQVRFEYSANGEERWEVYSTLRKNRKVKGTLGRTTIKEIIYYDWEHVDKADAAQILGNYGLTTEQFAEMQEAENCVANFERWAKDGCTVDFLVEIGALDETSAEEYRAYLAQTESTVVAENNGTDSANTESEKPASLDNLTKDNADEVNATKAAGTTKYTVSMVLSGGNHRANSHYKYDDVTANYKTLKGAVEAMIKAKIEQLLGNCYGQKKPVESATLTDASGAVIVDMKRDGTVETYGEQEETVPPTTTVTALTIYIPRFETTEVKTALELAEEEYRAANDEMVKAHEILGLIEDKRIEHEEMIDAYSKEFRKTEGAYKRSKNRATLARLYNKMVKIREKIDRIQPTVDSLNGMYAEFYNRYYVKACQKEQRAKNNVIEARRRAGLRFAVTFIGNKIGDNRVDVATMAEAVSFIYQNADNISSWRIFVDITATRQSTIAVGTTLDAEKFTALIKTYDVYEEIPEAEIAQPSTKDAVHYDTTADEFAAIAFRAIHRFTLDDFTTPISELREFIQRTGYAPAKDELAEWIEMAAAAGVEVPAETVESAAPEVNQDGVILFIKDYRPTYDQLGIKKEIKTWEAKYAEKDAWFWRGESHCSQVCWYWYDRRAYYYNRASLDRDVPTEGSLFMKAASEYTIEGQILLAIRRITLDKGNPNGYYDSPEAALARLISEYPQVAAAVDLDNEFVAWCFNDYFPREKAIAALNGDLSQIPQKDPLASVEVEEYAVTPEAHDAAIEGEIENAIKATAEAVEAPAREPADIHFGWLVENLNYCGGLKTRKIHVVRTITVASVDEAREFITMKSDRHLAPLNVRERAYCGQKTEYHEYNDITLNVREYTYSDSRYRRPIVFEIDDFNHGAGTFAEFYVDGEITVIRVDASTDISAAEATPEANTVNLGNVMERVVIETPYGLIQPYFHPKGTSINEIRELDARDAEISKKIASLHQPRKFEIVELRDEVFRVDSGIRDILKRRYAEIALANSYTTANGDIIFDADLVARLVSADKIYTAAEELYSEKRYRKHIEKLTAIYKGTPAVTVEESTSAKIQHADQFKGWSCTISAKPADTFTASVVKNVRTEKIAYDRRNFP